MLQYINWRVRITIQDTRMLVGTFLAFDRHLNMVLADTEEFRRIIPKGKKGGVWRKIPVAFFFILLHIFWILLPPCASCACLMCSLRGAGERSEC